MKTAMKATLGILVLAILLVLSGTFYSWRKATRRSSCSSAGPWGAGDPGGVARQAPFIQEVRRFEKRLLIWDGDPTRSHQGREFIWVDTTARWRIADARSSSRASRRRAAPSRA